MKDANGLKNKNKELTTIMYGEGDSKKLRRTYVCTPIERYNYNNPLLYTATELTTRTTQKDSRDKLVIPRQKET